MNETNSIAIKSFDALSKTELYGILALRMAVFCVEQDCPYQDLDERDQDAMHLFIKEGDAIIAYARILKKNKHCAIIGRVVVAQKYRHNKLASKIMQECIKTIKNQGFSTIELSAQSYLHAFYKRLGLDGVGKYYLEDNIPHEHMQMSI